MLGPVDRESGWVALKMRMSTNLPDGEVRTRVLVGSELGAEDHVISWRRDMFAVGAIVVWGWYGFDGLGLTKSESTVWALIGRESIGVGFITMVVEFLRLDVSEAAGVTA